MTVTAPPSLWARGGETVVCVNGHPICDIACDLYHGQARAAEHYVNWRQPAPDHSMRLAAIRCTECRGAWIRTNGQVHFADGWR